MRPFDVQSIAIDAPPDAVFRFVADRYSLPAWTHAFKRVDADAALLQTAAGAMQIQLSVRAHVEAGTVDWIMTFPDRSIGRAHAYIVANVDDTAIVCFVLLAPPVPLQEVEGALEVQRATLRDELQRLKEILERRE